MSDIGDDFRALRLQSQGKRQGNREQSFKILRHLGVDFDEKNNGAHLIVQHGGKVVDFWPGTGRWMIRGIAHTNRPDGQGRGIFPMLAALGVDFSKKL